MNARRLMGTAGACVAVFLLATQAFAQPREEWQRGTTLAGFIGSTVDGSSANMAAGASFGWEIVRYLGVEAQGAWIETGRDRGAFAGQMRARVPLRRDRAVVPFVAGGIGLYRATFDAGAALPVFYDRPASPGTGTATRRVFDDFMTTAGGGADVFVASHLALRPEVAALIVSSSEDTRVVPLLSLQLVYHFETHPVTERARRSR